MRMVAKFFGLVIGCWAFLLAFLGLCWGGPVGHNLELVGAWVMAGAALLYLLGCIPERARTWWRSTDPERLDRWDGWR